MVPVVVVRPKPECGKEVSTSSRRASTSSTAGDRFRARRPSERTVVDLFPQLVPARVFHSFHLQAGSAVGATRSRRYNQPASLFVTWTPLSKRGYGRETDHGVKDSRVIGPRITLASSALSVYG